MENTSIVRGYKVFNSDLTCRNFRYEIGKEYIHEGDIKVCCTGFHFCLKASHCFNYYAFDPSNRVCEVEALGKILTHDSDSKICTNRIRIVRELTWDEVLKVSNDGMNNTGFSNTGNRNTGNRNTGNWNTGNSNTGNSNTGYSNTGNSNTGYSNTGNSNTGYSNTGNWNTGNSNTGYRNTGNWNTGNSNTGYSNTGNWNTGVFCTGQKTIEFFNKKSDWTEEQFLNSKAYALLCQVNTKMWIYPSQMTDEEKESNPSWQTVDGYLKDIPFKEAFQNEWHNWSSSNRKAFTDLPNFDKYIFFEITGVEIDTDTDHA